MEIRRRLGAGVPFLGIWLGMQWLFEGSDEAPSVRGLGWLPGRITRLPEYYLTRTEADSSRLAEKRQQRQDWLFLLGFNHLFSGLEAFVSSHLHDLPADVRFRAVPQGFRAEVAVPFRIR